MESGKRHFVCVNGVHFWCHVAEVESGCLEKYAVLKNEPTGSLCCQFLKWKFLMLFCLSRNVCNVSKMYGTPIETPSLHVDS